MVHMKVQISAEKHARVRQLAETRGVSVNKLVNEWVSMAVAEFDAKTRFAMHAARGNVQRGVALLDNVDRIDMQRRASQRRTGK